MFNQTTLDENRNKALDLLLKEMDAVELRQFGKVRSPLDDGTGLLSRLEHKIETLEKRSKGNVNSQTK